VDDPTARVHTLAQDFTIEVAQLCTVQVSGTQWQSSWTATSRESVPRPHASSPDERSPWRTASGTPWTPCTGPTHESPPWTGTADGVLQTINKHHAGTVRGGSRVERNGLKTVHGDFERLDRTTWTTLKAVLDSTSALAS